ncbi:MAG: hypothetical protein ACTSVV_09815 [Promethearchaeota archaeon]
MIKGFKEVNKPFEDYEQELKQEIIDNRLDKIVRNETSSAAVLKKGKDELKLKKENNGEESESNSLRKLRTLNNLEKKFFLFCNHYESGDDIKRKADLYRRLSSSHKNITDIIKSLEIECSIDAKNFKYPRNAFEKLVLKMANRLNRYKNDVIKYQSELNNLLLILFKFREHFLNPKIVELKDLLIQKKVHVTFENEKVFVNGDNIKIVSISNKKKERYESRANLKREILDKNFEEFEKQKKRDGDDVNRGIKQFI